jgi:hypothetical protein
MLMVFPSKEEKNLWKVTLELGIKHELGQTQSNSDKKVKLLLNYLNERHVSLTGLLTHSLTLTHWLTHSLTGFLTHSLAYSLTHSLTHSLTLTHSLLLTHLLTHSPTHSLTHSLIRSYRASVPWMSAVISSQ